MDWILLGGGKNMIERNVIKEIVKEFALDMKVKQIARDYLAIQRDLKRNGLKTVKYGKLTFQPQIFFLKNGFKIFKEAIRDEVRKELR